MATRSPAGAEGSTRAAYTRSGGAAITREAVSVRVIARSYDATRRDTWFHSARTVDLASEYADYVYGTTRIVDGGRLAD